MESEVSIDVIVVDDTRAAQKSVNSNRQLNFRADLRV